MGHIREQDAFSEQMRSLLGEDPAAGVQRFRAELDRMHEQAAGIAAGEALSAAADLLAAADEVGGVRLIRGQVDLSAEQLKILADSLEEKGRPAVVILGGAVSGRAIVLCKRSNDIANVHAGALVKEMAKAVNGRGGGSPTFAEGGGSNLSALSEALDTGAALARESLSAAGPCG